jgi:hypothetical protein
MADSGVKFQVVSNNLGALQGQLRGLAFDATRETMDDIHVDILRRVHEPGRGRIYVHNGLMHQASAPGQAPAAETGGLMASIEVGVAMTPTGPVGIVHTDHEAAAPLEYGAPARNLAPRPFMTPAGAMASGPFKDNTEKRLRTLGQ